MVQLDWNAIHTISATIDSVASLIERTVKEREEKMLEEGSKVVNVVP